MSTTLKELYAERGLSRAELAEAAGCSVAVIRLTERGYQPTTKAIRRGLASALGIAEPELSAVLVASGATEQSC